MTIRPDPLADELRAALEEDATTDGDDALLARAVEGAASRLARERVASLPPRRRSSKTLRFVLPLAAAFAATVALAAFYGTTRDPEPVHVKPPPSPVAPVVEAPPAAPTTTPAETPTISVDDLPTAAAPQAPPPSAMPALGPAELFKMANAERRSGDVDRAVSLYRTLIDKHPDAAESQPARVSLGRLLLDKRGDANGALAQFDAYLANARDGALAEEARVGRATAFQRLGRASEEKAAWEDLLKQHPATVHATRARERLDALP